jgi:hypothetical protein
MVPEVRGHGSGGGSITQLFGWFARFGVLLELAIRERGSASGGPLPGRSGGVINRPGDGAVHSFDQNRPVTCTP